MSESLKFWALNAEFIIWMIIAVWVGLALGLIVYALKLDNQADRTETESTDSEQANAALNVWIGPV
jgi:NADH:ubiquinone oxidoreductase subunit 6 (subunit J)